jgi:hypothetical protein
MLDNDVCGKLPSLCHDYLRPAAVNPEDRQPTVRPLSLGKEAVCQQRGDLFSVP